MGNLAFLSHKREELALGGEHGGNTYEAKRLYKKEVIDFSANINPLGLPITVKRAICDNLDRIIRYPDGEAKDITQTIAKYWDIEEENVLVGNGSVEFIYLVISAYRPKRVLVPAPTFSEYERAAKNAKSKIKFLTLEESFGFKFDLSCHTKADIFFLCHPNNPTGNFILEDRKIIDRLPDDLFVIDEAFMDFLPDQRNYTLIWKAVENKKIVVLRTFTKFFALPGLRMGYAIAHKKTIDRLKQYQPPWSTNSLAQLAAKTILSDKEYIKKTAKFIENERKFLFERLAKIEGLKPFPSVTNFILLKIEKATVTSKILKKALIKKGILIRDCANFRTLNDKYARIAVRSRKENRALLEALSRIL